MCGQDDFPNSIDAQHDQWAAVGSPPHQVHPYQYTQPFHYQDNKEQCKYKDMAKGKMMRTTAKLHLFWFFGKKIGKFLIYLSLLQNWKLLFWTSFNCFSLSTPLTWLIIQKTDNVSSSAGICTSWFLSLVLASTLGRPYGPWAVGCSGP